MVEKDMTSNGKREMSGTSLSAAMETKKSSKILAEEAGQWLPGILDDITLNHITPKLSWRDVHALSSASPVWHRAVESRQVYNKRVCSHSTETIAVVYHINPGRERGMGLHVDHDEDIHVLSLYSIRDKYWYDLPPIPFCGGVQGACQHVSLDGKLYVLGGVMDPARDLGSQEVYMLDVAGQGQWKRCARMHEPRLNFGASVLDGKIFVFGGCSLDKPVYGCEVYDPKMNTWSPIEPTQDCRVNHKVATVGEELIVYGGQYLADHTDLIDPDNMREHLHPIYSDIDDALVLDVYHPVKGEWRQIEPFEEQDGDEVHDSDKLFMAQGKQLHMMTVCGFYVYDIEKDLWSLLHSFLGAPDGFLASGLVGCVMALGDELLYADYFTRHSGNPGCCLFQSKGFGSNRIEIAWEKAKSSLFFDRTCSSFVCPIQL